MANVIENRLVIQGEISLVTQIIKDLDEHGMKYFVPRPEYLTNAKYPDSDPSRPNWLEWSYSNWGTKWEMYESVIEECDTLYFLTANGPANHFTQKMQDLFPQLTFFLSYVDEYDNELFRFIPTK